MDGIRYIPNQALKGENSFDIKSKDLSHSTSAGASFSDTLTKAITDVNDLQVTANKEAEKLATGRTENISDVLITAEKADIALRLMVQVRNKMLEAYQEIMKMQA